MSVRLDYCAAMTNNKFSMVSVSSTCAGDSSSESVHSLDMSLNDEMHSNPKDFSTNSWSNQDGPEQDWSYNNTFGFDRSKMPSTRENSPEPLPLFDRSDMPSTRENSPEPYWNNANLYKWNDPSVQSMWNTHRASIQDHAARHSLHRRSSRDPPAMTQRQDVNPPVQQQRYQTVLLVPHDQPVLFVRSGQDGNVMLPMNTEQAVPLAIQTTPTPVSPTVPSASMTATPEPEQEQAAAKSNNKTRERGHTKTDSVFNRMSADQKDALCKYVYDLMVHKGFTSQEGYLIVDIFSEVWKEMWQDIDDSAEGWRAAKHRFGDLLRSSPQYFRLFRKGIRVANQCGWFARKGEKMVRLVLENEK
jgi:hypothetical protein